MKVEDHLDVVMDYIDEIAALRVRKNMEVILLGMLPDLCLKDKSFVMSLLAAAKMVYVRHWRLNIVPDQKAFMRKILYCSRNWGGEITWIRQAQTSAKE